MTTGTSAKVMKVHAVVDGANNKAAFYMTRTPLERMRNHARAADFQFYVGIEVPINSDAARFALEHWLRT